MQAQRPCSPFSASSRSSLCPSRGSPTNRIAFASACGPVKCGSDSIELHSETQQPQLMQSDSLWMTFIRSCVMMFSLPAGGSSKPGCRYGLTLRNFSQNGSMSTTRSFTTGRFPIAETTGIWPACAMSYMRTLQARTAAPFSRMPHEPQIIIRQLFR